MKIGVIIIFHNNERDINTKIFINQIKQTSNLELCLVNNASKDNTSQLLEDIKESCNNVSTVNIKKFKSDMAAARAGARFMFNKFNLRHLGHVTTNLININNNGLNNLIKLITENQDQLVAYNIKTIENQEVKQTLFQSLFSVLDCLKKLNIKNQFINLQYERRYL